MTLACFPCKDSKAASVLQYAQFIQGTCCVLLINDVVLKAAYYSSCLKGKNGYNYNRKEEDNDEGLGKHSDHLPSIAIQTK